jgi:hypothetical protein
MSDTLIFPVAQQLLDCLCAALPLDMAAAKVPAHCAFRPGEIVSADASVYEDLCCEGLAWVRIADIYPSATDFPAPDTLTVVTGCGPMGWGVALEMGVMRCAPTGSFETIPTDAEWLELQQDIMNDAAAMRRAMCCMIAQYDPSSIAIGSWQPLPTTGGCAGGLWSISVQLPNDCQPC